MNGLFLPIGYTICVIASTASVASLLRLKPQSDGAAPLDRALLQDTLNPNRSDKDRSNVFSTVIHITRPEACLTTCRASEDV
ncbi:hypothetical protein PHLGIDRAFT_450000 [Phlebiopsis gigantea 11061_1 CR5-6]|uniref:Uncharacterized protein n=1 Tax=Phlebiopsis gigantea (strain 11061_1 CR5-6) TaxID=745531 RepID=A0A0C3SA11_PHLG1|nr:hypothetical protein PHLGIDRAFT_450000 [Phlebiopsis gigantea 11061_1 CR5-6]